MRPRPAGGLTVPVLLGIGLELEGPGRAYSAYPNLREVRWLLPTDRPVLRQAGIRGLYQPSSFRGLTLKKLVDIGMLRGERVWLDENALARLESAIAQALGKEAIRLAFYVGVPSPQQKITAQVLSLSGKTLGYVKIASSPLAQAAVEAERRALLQLAESEPVRGNVPEVLAYFPWQEGKALLMTSGPGEAGPKELSSVHSSFCECIFLPFAEENAFGESPMWARMTKVFRRLKADLPDPLPTYYDRAFQHLSSELGPVPMPLSLAHCDFAPWNTRIGPEGLFVVDWERAEQQVIPLYDVFHFQAIQAALFKRGGHLPNRRFLDHLLPRLWPEGREHLPWLYLAYLVDMSLVYSEAQIIAPGVGEQRVWRWFVEQIEAFLKDGSPL